MFLPGRTVLSTEFLLLIPCPVALTRLPHCWRFKRVRCRQRTPPPQAIAVLKVATMLLAMRCSNWLCGLLQPPRWKKSKQILPFLPPLPPIFLEPPPLPAPAIPGGRVGGGQARTCPPHANRQTLPPMHRCTITPPTTSTPILTVAAAAAAAAAARVWP